MNPSTRLDDHAQAASGGELHRIVTGPGALDSLPDLVAALAPTGTVLLVTDDTPKQVGEADLLGLVHALLGRTLEGRVHDYVLTVNEHGLTNDEATVSAMQAGARGAALVLSVGSGTITDLAKTANPHVPLVAVQTALSVNGYADPLSVLVVNGAKRTSPTRWPTALVIDDKVMARAPDRLTRAGVGDAIAIWSAPADWYLSSALGMGGDYAAEVVAPVFNAVERLDDPDNTAARAALLDALTLGGLQIGIAGSTAPLSGVDHLVSHVLDMAAMASGRGHDLHGAQVGVATVVALALWELIHEHDLLATPMVDLDYPVDLEERTRATWAPLDPSGRLGAECWSAVSAKATRWRGARRSEFDRHTLKHRQVLREMTPPARRAAEVLQHWNAATRFSDLAPAVDADQARWALMALPFMRDRLTVCDLLLMSGRWNDDLIEAVFTRAGAAGGGR